jgi:predicted Zn-dependent peptidase
MKRIFIFLFAILFFAQFAFAKIETFNLSNGIKVIFDKTDGVKVASIKVWTPVSVIDENKKNAGISNLLNLVMEESTLNRSVKILSSDIEDIGASLSGEVNYDYAYLGMNFLSEFTDKAVEILADVIINPAFDRREIDYKKTIQIADINSRKDDISATAFDAFNSNFYKNTPYALPVEGTLSSVKEITVEELKSRHKYAYNASNIIITVSGNISKRSIKNSLEKYFSKIEKGAKFEKPLFGAALPKEKIFVQKGKFNQAFIVKGYPAPSLRDKNFVVLKVINEILGGKMTSRLFIELREKLGLAYEVGALYPTRIEESYFGIYIGLDKKNIGITLKKIDEVLKDLMTEKITDMELKDIKSYLKGNYLMSRQRVSNRSLTLGLREIWGQGYEYDLEYLNDIDKVSAEDVHRAANEIFNQRSFTVIIE